MSLRTFLIICLAMGAGLAAAIGARQLLQNQTEVPEQPMASVVVVTRDLSRGESLSELDLATERWPQGSVPEGVVRDIQTAKDRVVLTHQFKGSPIYESYLAPIGTPTGLASLIPEGMRAFTIRTPSIATGVAGFILPENNVDVLLTVRGPQEAEGGVTVTLLQDVKVLAVDQRVDAPTSNTVDSNELQSVTLLVNPEQATKLSLAHSKGELHLSLRNPQDRGAGEVTPITLAELRLFGLPPEPEPEPQPEPEQKPEPVPQEIVQTVSKVSPPPVLKIRTLRGTHSGMVIVNPKDNETSESDVE